MNPKTKTRVLNILRRKHSGLVVERKDLNYVKRMLHKWRLQKEKQNPHTGIGSPPLLKSSTPALEGDKTGTNSKKEH